MSSRSATFIISKFVLNNSPSERRVYAEDCGQLPVTYSSGPIMQCAEFRVRVCVRIQLFRLVLLPVLVLAVGTEFYFTSPHVLQNSTRDLRPTSSAFQIDILTGTGE